MSDDITLTCEDALGPFEWLLDTDSIRIEVWRSVICQNSSALQDELLMDWLPLIQKVKSAFEEFPSKVVCSLTFIYYVKNIND